MVKDKIASAAAVIAVALSFAMYAAAFEPFGAAEFAYLFAVPAILACRFLCGKIDRFAPPKRNAEYTERMAKLGLPLEPDEFSEESDVSPKCGTKIWLVSTFIFSFAAWVAILAWLRHVYPPAGWAAVILLPLIISAGFIFPWFAMLPRLLPSLREHHGARSLKLLGLAGLWVVLEWVRSWIFTGFPWSLLAHALWQRPASIQTAEFGGPWIVSFALIFFNLAVAEYVYRLYAAHVYTVRSRFSGKPPFGRFAPEFYIALLAAFASVWVYILQLPKKQNELKAFTAAMVQTDFAGILKWDDSLAKQNVEIIGRLTRGVAPLADVVLWPEAATPPRWPAIGTPEMRAWIERLSKETKTPILMGNMAYFYEDRTAQNAAFAVSPDSGLSEKFYAKRKLVPFGEYVPSWCSLLGKVVPVGNMKRGTEPVLLNLKISGKDYKIGSMICYEDIFPQAGRELANAGADIFFVCTNDSWYGREGGAWQHAAHSAFQAVSNRRPLLRASNNGLSTVFDQYGRMIPSFELKNPDGSTWNASVPLPAPELKITNEAGSRIDPKTLAPRRAAPLHDSKGSIYFRGAGTADVIFYSNFVGKTTFYAKHGDWFVGVCALFLAAACLSGMSSRAYSQNANKKKLEASD